MVFKQQDVQNHELFNIQGSFMYNLGETIFELEEHIERASTGKAHYFDRAVSELVTLRNKCLGVRLTIRKRSIEIIDLNIKIAKIYSRQNKFQEASDYLWNAYVEIMQIIKFNEILFPKKTKGLSFKKFVESEIK